jgi:glycosyltransferase involved in cell wall biosynthesis
MKIFHIISNKVWGGGEQTVLDLARRQLQDGIDIELFCLPKPDIVERFRELGVPIHTLPLGGALDLKSAWQMSRILKAQTDCIVHAHNFKEAFTAAYARVLARRMDIRLVMCRNLTRRGKNSLIYRWLYRQLDCIVFDSQVALDEFLTTDPDIDHRKLSVIHNGIVVPEGIEPADVRSEFGIRPDEVLAIYHGRLDPEKGLDTVVEAVGLLPADCPLRVVLVGRGSDEYTDHLRSLIAERHLEGKIQLAGFRNPILPYVAAADFGVLASIVAEGCSLSAQEHLALGHPVVATNNGGQREYIDDGQNGLLVEPGRADQLAQALRRLITDAPLRQKLGEQAKADFDDHMNYEHYYAQIRTLYQLPQ